MIITTPTPVLVWRGSQESIAKVREILLDTSQTTSFFIHSQYQWLESSMNILNHAKQSQRKLLINSLLTRSFQLHAHNITYWQDLEPLCRAEQKYHQNIVLHHYYFTKSSTEKASFTCNHNYNKIVKSDWLSTAPISALIGQFYWTVRAITRALKWLFFSLLAKQNFEFLVF